MVGETKLAEVAKQGGEETKLAEERAKEETLQEAEEKAVEKKLAAVVNVAEVMVEVAAVISSDTWAEVEVGKPEAVGMMEATVEREAGEEPDVVPVARTQTGRNSSDEPKMPHTP